MNRPSFNGNSGYGANFGGEISPKTDVSTDVLKVLHTNEQLLDQQTRTFQELQYQLSSIQNSQVGENLMEVKQELYGLRMEMERKLQNLRKKVSDDFEEVDTLENLDMRGINTSQVSKANISTCTSHRGSPGSYRGGPGSYRGSPRSYRSSPGSYRSSGNVSPRNNSHLTIGTPNQSYSEHNHTNQSYSNHNQSYSNHNRTSQNQSNQSFNQTFSNHNHSNHNHSNHSNHRISPDFEDIFTEPRTEETPQLQLSQLHGYLNSANLDIDKRNELNEILSATDEILRQIPSQDLNSKRWKEFISGLDVCIGSFTN